MYEGRKLILSSIADLLYSDSLKQKYMNVINDKDNRKKHIYMSHPTPLALSNSLHPANSISESKFPSEQSSPNCYKFLELFKTPFTFLKQ
jgi:hypothetical protein